MFEEMTEETKYGWKTVFETDYDEEGRTYFVVQFGQDGMPAHGGRTFETKEEALAFFKEVI